MVFGSNRVAAIQTYEALTQYSSAISAHLSSLGAAASASLGTFISNVETEAQSAVNVAGTGYYLISPTATALDANSLATTINAITGISITGDTLTKINSIFSASGYTDGSAFVAGGFLHVPSASLAAGAMPDPTKTYVLYNGHAYAVGPSLNGSTGGSLFTILSGGQIVSAPYGTWDSIPSLSTAELSLGDSSVATLSASSSITLADGAVISLTSVPTTAILATPTSGETSEQALLSYLSSLGDTTTASALSTTDFTYNNPTGSAYSVTGTVSGTTDTFTSDNGAPGATIAGASGKTNVLDAEGDVSQDALSNLQQLNLDGNLALTSTELNAFTAVAMNDDTLTITTGGTVNLTNARFSAGSIADVIATGWAGTIITGDSEADQSLAASLYGNDTLTAGSGTGDILTAGQGVDLLTGSTSGSTTIEAVNGLAPGSSVTGHGTGNLMYADGDISGATISSIQTLYITTSITTGAAGAVTLTAAQLGGFTTVEGLSPVIYASGAGTYSVSADLGTYTLYGDATGNTTLTNNGNGQAKDIADGTSGNDTLSAGNGTGDTLSAQGSTGNDTLTAGTGVGDVLNVSGSTGTDTLTGGSGGDTFYSGFGVDSVTGGSGNDTFNIADGIGSGSSVNGGTGTNNITTTASDLTGVTISNVTVLNDNSPVLDLTAAQFAAFTTFNNSTGNAEVIDITNASGSYSFSGKTVTGNISLSAADSTGTVTLTAGNAAGQTLQAGSGTDTLVAGTGGDTLIDGPGTDTLTGGTGADTFDILYGTSGTTASGGSTDTVYGASSIAGVTFTGMTSLSIANIDLGLTSAQYGTFTTLTNSLGGAVMVDITNASGSYSLTGKTVTGNVGLSALGSSAAVTLTATAAGEELQAGSGTDTLAAMSGGNILIAGTGADTLTGSSGNDTFQIGNNLASGTTISGSTGTNIVDFVVTANIGSATISNAPTVQIDNGALAEMTSSQYSAFTTFNNTATTGVMVDITNASGSYSLSGKTVTGNVGLSALGSASTVTLTASNTAGEELQAGSGTDTLVAGTGGDSLIDGTGVDTLTGGSGNDIFDLNNATSGSSVTGGAGTNTIVDTAANLTGITISGVQALSLNGTATELTASEFSNFSSFINTSSTAAATLQASNAGTYSLSGKTAIGDLNLDASLSTGTVTLIGNNQADQGLTGGSGTTTLEAGNGAGDFLIAGSGTQTLMGGSGNDALAVGSGVDNITGGSGYNYLEVYNLNLASGDVLNGGTSGGNTLATNGTNIDISLATISNVQSLSVDGTVTLTASQLALFNTITTGNSSATIQASAAGSYSLAGATVNQATTLIAAATGTSTLTAGGGTGTETLISNNQASQTLIGGSGTDILEAGTGGGDYLEAGSGTQTLIGGAGNDALAAGAGLDTITGGSSYNYLEVYNVNLASGDVLNGGTSGGNTLATSGTNVNISLATISNVQKLDDDGTVTLTASQLALFNTITTDNSSATIQASAAGTFSLSGANVEAPMTLIAASTGNSTLIGSNGTESLTGGTGNDTLEAGSGNDTLTGGGGTNAYDFGSSFGQDSINNVYTGITTANGTIGFASGVTDESLWFKQSGNNLLIELLGTTDTVTVDNWFGSNAGAQVSEVDAGSLKLTSGVMGLISAMSTYQSAHTGFNPQTAGTTMPTDTTLQNAITTAWHT